MKPDHVDPELDPSFAALMNDVNMSLKRHKKEEKPYVAAEDITPVPASEKPPPTEEAEEEEGQVNRRPPRRSPAAIFGTKNIGMIILPEWLVEGVQNEIERTCFCYCEVADSNQEVDNRRIVRDRYMELLKPKPEKASKSETRNTEEHALARAAAFLPAQYAAVANVLSELRTRVGDITGPILESTDGIAPGLWWVLEHETSS